MTRAGWARALATGALVGLVLGSGTVVALAQAPDEVLRGCAQERSGALRLLAADERCRQGERGVTWSVRGPQGPVGPQGPPGPEGGEQDWFLSCQEAFEVCARQEVVSG